MKITTMIDQSDPLAKILYELDEIRIKARRTRNRTLTVGVLTACLLLFVAAIATGVLS